MRWGTVRDPRGNLGMGGDIPLFSTEMEIQRGTPSLFRKRPQPHEGPPLFLEGVAISRMFKDEGV